MADKSKIEWTDSTWNVITGCSVVSPGCKHCYAMKLAGTRMKHHWSRKGLTTDTKAGPVWNGQLSFNVPWLAQPLEWTRKRLIFVNAHGDTFHENVPVDWLDKIFAVMGLAFVTMDDPHIFQVLTKRSKNLRAYLGDPETVYRVTAMMKQLSRELLGDGLPGENAAPDWPLPNVWLGVSCEDQPRFDERVADLYNTPAAIRFFSFEPLLGPIDAKGPLSTGAFHWAIVGGESGANARPMNPQWARDLRDQCQAAGVAFHFKQNGEWVSVSEVEGEGPWHTFDDGRSVRRVGKKAAGRTLDGRTWDGMPA
jgi:protein gp37